jgi:hypothetical protein
LLLSTLFLAVAACLCQYAPYANKLTTEQPGSTALIGAYVLTAQTLTNDGLDFLQGRQAKIQLFSDGTFSADDFPIWQETNTGAYVFDELDSADGNWSIEVVGGVSSNHGDLKPVWGISFSGAIISAGLTGNQSPYGLIFTFGDPDSGRVMIFEFDR